MPYTKKAVAVLAAIATLTLLPIGLSAQDKPVSPAHVPGPTAAEAAALAAVIRSNATLAQKQAACKRLGEIGSKEQVGVLASLLADERLSHAARRGLEAIPDPSATDALRRALPGLKGKTLVGVLHSLGARRDPSPAADVIARLGNADPQVAAAAAYALGRIATPEAGRALVQSLSTSPGTVRPAIADGGLACAEAFVRGGRVSEAVSVYEAIRKAELPKHIRAAATRGVILAWRPGSAEVLIAQLRDKDHVAFATALGAVREVADPGVTPILLGQLPHLVPQRQALLLTALGSRGDVAARPPVLEAAKSGPPEVRIAALRALATLGDASAVPVLLESINQADPAIAAAARDSLSAMADPSINAALGSMIGKAQGKSRCFLFDLVGRRQIVAAVPTLVAAADDPDADIRIAALRALGRTITPQDLPVLTARLLAPKNPAERTVVQEALKATCVRAPDKNMCAERIGACLPQASPKARGFLFDLLGIVGGPAAMRTVAAATFDANVETRDAAVRVLGKWRTPDAAGPLLEVARKSSDAKLRVRALRGYIRIIRQLDLPNHQKLAMCREAMASAERDEERVLALGALGRVRTVDALTLAATHLNTPPLKEAACLACLAISEKIVATQPGAVAEAMPKVLDATKDVDVVRRAKEMRARATKK
jgi:HEAT repeat protein